jgi:hypothetical protein
MVQRRRRTHQHYEQKTIIGNAVRGGNHYSRGARPGAGGRAGDSCVRGSEYGRHPAAEGLSSEIDLQDSGDAGHPGEIPGDRLPHASVCAHRCCIPRTVAQFFSKYPGRILYGTDMGYDEEMYRTTFRILETADEHFYHFQFGYHWYLNGFNLPDTLLKKIYRDNALAAFDRARQNMA